MLSSNNISARERNHTLVLEAGLYLLRYASTHAPEDPPFIQVQPSDADVGVISLMSGPGASHQRLREPGAYLLVQANRPSALDLTVCSRRADGSLDAEVRLERIITDQSGRNVVAAESDFTEPPETVQPDVEILAHVSHRGDTTCRQGEWICGPKLPMPIEGIEIRWPNKPTDVELVYTAFSGRRNQQRSRETRVGDFVGTRGKSAPLVGLMLGLKGRHASLYELRCDALFLGSQVLSRTGAEITLSGPTGQEPLVGFRLSIVPTKTFSPKSRTTQTADPISAKQGGRVRVFRRASTLAP